MRKCKFEDSIDNYLFNRLSEMEKEKFEEHYFNCMSCFEKMAERDELIEVVKRKGDVIFQDAYLPEESKPMAWFENVVSFLTPKQWALAAVSAAMLLIVLFGIIPSFKKTSPQFFLNVGEVDETVRGQSINLISPIIDIKTVPSFFEWEKIEEDVEYKISIYDHDLLWSASTKEAKISLPEEIKKIMIAGQKYCWQVKAFSPQGVLVAVSSKVQFKIAN